ncbi:MAG: DNA utilization protein HofN [Pluralibacter gergoviae]|nr:DNA utilization protein HofN [Pluralibacter gergoviae]
MPRPVDLLPWRQNRRRRVLRFWGLMFAALPLLAAALYGRQQAEQIHTQALTAAWTHADASLSRALAARETLLEARLAEEARLRRRLVRLRQTAGWESALTTLAAQLPERAWLTAVGWREGTLSLSGLTARFATLAELDAALRALPHWDGVTPGATRRDARGRWQFSYRLQRTEREPASG